MQAIQSIMQHLFPNYVPCSEGSRYLEVVLLTIAVLRVGILLVHRAFLL